MEYKKTNRGFKLINFYDNNDELCSIQESSSAESSKLWLGVEDANPMVLTSNGWKKYNIPEDVLLTTRMHINKEQALELIQVLEYFVKTGKLPEK